MSTRRSNTTLKTCPTLCAKLQTILQTQKFMAEKNLTVTIRHITKTESRCKKWPGRIWQQIRKTLGTAFVRDEPFLVYGSSLSEVSLIYRELYNIAKCNKYRTADIEIATSRQEPSPTETIETMTLLFQKQPVCQAVLRTTWSHDDVEIQVSAPFDLLVPLLTSGHSLVAGF